MGIKSPHEFFYIQSNPCKYLELITDAKNCATVGFLGEYHRPLWCGAHRPPIVRGHKCVMLSGIYLAITKAINRLVGRDLSLVARSGKCATVPELRHSASHAKISLLSIISRNLFIRVQDEKARLYWAEDRAFSRTDATLRRLVWWRRSSRPGAFNYRKFRGHCFIGWWYPRCAESPVSSYRQT